MVTGDEAQEAAAEGRLVGGRYRLDERLGSGGMGTVWAGHDLLVRREVAVKEAHTAHDPARVERVLREARAAARVNHPGVVTVHDIVIEDGHPWIVMERVRGESLADRLDREGALPEREAARVALRVVEALTAAHERDVLHRDVKPANVLLREDGGVVLTDFGIAYITGEKPLTQTGEFVGSLAYTAPERMGGRRPGPASDLWSLGVLLFQMVEGWAPFQRDSMEETVTAVVVDETPPTRLADTLAPVVHALLAKNPDHRPSSAEVAESLRAAAEKPAAPAPAAAEPAAENPAGEEGAAEEAVGSPGADPAARAPAAGGLGAEVRAGADLAAQAPAAGGAECRGAGRCGTACRRAGYHGTECRCAGRWGAKCRGAGHCGTECRRAGHRRSGHRSTGRRAAVGPSATADGASQAPGRRGGLRRARLARRLGSHAVERRVRPLRCLGPGFARQGAHLVVTRFDEAEHEAEHEVTRSGAVPRLPPGPGERIPGGGPGRLDGGSPQRPGPVPLHQG
ncbi:serine/threonine-protein kinase [Streptomyces sp. NPDC012637]|uniref:serine/threonine-protein kinase n=1 Tax=Streptomyces sp. NPDC012637 TaxID=3364842 RepID=UPI0036F04A04